VAAAFAEQDVSIKSIWQDGRGDEAQLVVITHRAEERRLRACVERLRSLEVVHSVTSVMRVVGGEP
jgi:homoserine dehydrogenase